MPIPWAAGTLPMLSTTPEGNSIRFVPTDPSDWDKLPGPHRGGGS
jgi:hypothetical protein